MKGFGERKEAIKPSFSLNFYRHGVTYHETVRTFIWRSIYESSLYSRDAMLVNVERVCNPNAVTHAALTRRGQPWQ